MHLRSLTIKGFKSFARKTILEFEPGVTIIVGPNGSGKSNIADAVMWVLGEQSPTSLRGNRMEDIIFAGSASLKPVNLAEVVLTLDNSNNIFPLDYAEITVSRNVVRGGDSEYRLNNNSCRLLDIQELLSDAGVGRTLNSVISQGQLDEVLSCRPEERRDYIEEAGGLLKYRRRREKAVRRLSRMEEELVRTNDVIREVRRQLRPLQRQAGRLEQYQSLTRELADAQLRLDVAHLRAMQKEWQLHQDVQDARGRCLEELERELAGKAKAASELEDRQAGWRTREAGLRESLYRLVSLHERLKALLGLWDERSRRHEVARPATDPAELKLLEAVNREMEGRKAELEADSDRLRSQEAQLSERIRELNHQLNDSSRQGAALQARIEVLRSAEGELGAVGPRMLADKKEEFEALESQRRSLEGEMAGLEESARARLEEVGVLEERQAQAEEKRAGTQEALRSLEGEQAGLLATLDLLCRLETESWSVLNTAASLKAGDPTGGGLGGTLAESMKIRPEYESAVMSFLGPWAFGLIARDGETIKQAIMHLKRHGLGQSLFFRHSGEDALPGAGESAPAPAGSLRARDVVEAQEWFDNALDALLDGVFIAPDLDEAFRLAELHRHQVFLTPEGDVISGGALVKGGSLAVNRVHLELTLSRREKMEEALSDCNARSEELELGRKAVEKEAADAARELRDARGKLGEATAAAARRSGSLAWCLARIEEVKGAIADLAGREEGVPDPEMDPDELEERLRDLRQSEADLVELLRKSELARGEASGAHASAGARLASLGRELEAGIAKEGRLRGELERAEDRLLELPAELQAEITERLAGFHRRLVEQVSRMRERVRVDIEEGALKAEEDARTLRAMREEVGKLQDGHEEVRDQVHGEDLSRAELKIRVEQLVERIVDGHKVPLDFALKQYPEEEPGPGLEEKVHNLTAELEHIGPVNPEAIIEREALEQRFEFLKTQTDDIEKSKAQLRRVVRQVDQEIEDNFKQTLGTINDHFQDIFRTLFPNGSAELRLTDPDDLLVSGVEILAQPEGKRLRRISLLSGGETSLTALAFFFALFKVRPSPFYFLDEVEAALDDVNLHRFLDLVKQFKDESQLILITHQKRSMEIADILYGVTMQEDGVSRVVSQKVAS